MTYFKDVFTRDNPAFDKFFVGYDNQIKRIQQLQNDFTKNIPNYPPYNIKKVDDNRYAIEIAVAGFAKSQLEIELQDDKLIVKGSSPETANSDNTPYLFKGIGSRDFVHTFAVSDQIEIRGADLINGMLKIVLERIIPEHRKPKKIEISDEPSTVTEFAAHNSQLLTEQDVNEIAEDYDIAVKRAAILNNFK